MSVTLTSVKPLSASREAAWMLGLTLFCPRNYVFQKKDTGIISFNEF
jgi:hypothetical protein